MNRIIIVIVTVVLILSGTLASAASFQPFYSHTTSIDAQLSISSKGIATCSGEVEPRVSSSSASATVVLQQKKNGAWIQFAKWSGGSYVKGTKKVAAGYSYRVVVFGVVKNSSGNILEKPTATSKEKSY